MSALLVPDRNDVFPVGEALGQLALAEEQVALLNGLEMSPAHHLEGVDMDIGDIDVAWPATGQFTGVRSAALRHLISAPAGEREGRHPTLQPLAVRTSMKG
jgi:hypothetical protein